MDIELSPVETRVLGCLIEKEATTPDVYPLSVNALRTACNQKTNRDPVMQLSEAAVQEAIDALVKRTFAARRSGAGSRVAKYAHRVHDRLRDEMSFARDELAIMGVLFLRGPQTRGELRTRCERLFPFESLEQVQAALDRLASRDDGPYVKELPVQPGQKEARFAHLLNGEPEIPAAAAASPAAASAVVTDDALRLARLEHRVEEQGRELDELRKRLEGFMRRFE